MKERKTICPICGRPFTGYPALSRKDNKTVICAECGVKEALNDAGISPHRQEEIMIQITKTKYKPGMRVRLLKMDDVQAPPIGTQGTVKGVDDIGSVMVAWDNGSGLNVVLGEDVIEIIE